MPRTKSLERMSVGEIERIYLMKKQRLGTLQDRRLQLAKELRGVERELKIIGGRGGLGSLTGRRMPKNDRPLRDYVLQVLGKAKKGMKTGDVAQAVLEAGYQTRSDRFQLIVYAQLNKLVESRELKKDDEAKTYQIARS